MDTLKRWAFWIIVIIVFFFFSNFLIAVGLNSSYKDMSVSSQSQDDNNGKINVYQAQSTLIDGRITGSIENNGNEDISNKYLKIELFNKDGELIGENYKQIGEVSRNGIYPFDINFQTQGVKSYNLSIVDKLPESFSSFKLLDFPLEKDQFLLLLVFALASGALG